MPVIVKGDGERQEFSAEKLKRSLVHSGASGELSEKVAAGIAKDVRDGMTTTEIYKKAFQMLHKEEHVVAVRYSMRRAILDLGPTGFPFERYFAALMHAEGYETVYDVVVKGRCAEHEVDVVMKKGGHAIGAELKFHNTPGFKTDVKIALYVRARFWDIEWGAEDRHEKSGIDEGWLVTNTKFTSNAEQYAACSGIKLLGWNYPQGAGLANMIQKTGVYPVTVLTTLSNTEKMRLIASGTSLCHEVAKNPHVLSAIGIPDAKVQSIVAESAAVCTV